jgi:1-deoxyxylulose-5-phosphate synthase
MLAPLEIERRPLGDSGLTLPRIALGCGNFVGVGSSLDLIGQGLTPSASGALMDAAWEMGITHFDTADAYGGGHSEQVIGRWIESRGVRPTLTTKTFNPIFPGADQGLSAKRISKRLPGSLERLGVTHVDLYLAHDYDPAVPLAETMEAFETLKRARLILAYGVSNFTEMQLIHAMRAGQPVAVQNGYSLLERGDELDVIPYCRKQGLSFIAFSPLAGGWLTGKYQQGQAFPSGSRMTQRPDPYRHLVKPRTFEALAKLEQFATGRGSSMAAVALAWLLADDRVAQVVVGPGRPEHLEPIREALEQPLTDAERKQLGAIFA